VTVGVILPSYNVGAHLQVLLSEIHEQQPDSQILVVDDGSSDETAAIAESSGVHLVRHPVNRGKGRALQTGYSYALDHGWEWVYTMDADGQHLPAEMDRFLEAARRHGWDIVVGTRMADTATMPWLRKATNRLTSSIISRLCGFSVPDSQSGYRLFRTACLSGLSLKTWHYEAESEILVRLARRGFRIGAVPIATVYAGQSSSIRPLLDTWRFTRLVARLLVDRR
jgi:glycosyltransferase involved in cell wall biosynthesis